MKKNNLIAPILKWVGGKRQLLDVLIPLLPKQYKVYCEPFIGGGALLFSQQPNIAHVNDSNPELINVYEVVKKSLNELLRDLENHRNEAEYFYEIRDWDRDKEHYSSLSPIKRASRTIYLNKTCYNGLFRVNNAGEFNTPFGSYKNPNIVNAVTLKAVSHYLNNAKVEIHCGDYYSVLQKLSKFSFVYLDPPYHPVSDTSNFTGYTKSGFDKNEQIRLKECCEDLNRRGIKFMLSNSAVPFILELYEAYNITIIQAKRAINSISTKRGDVDEIVVRNYE